MIYKRKSLRIDYSPLFSKKIAEAPTEIKVAFKETLEIFLEDPNSESLRNHELRGKYSGFRSIDITGDWRALYRKESKRVIFVELGTHQELYG